jgi:hypothetical protein
MTVSTIDERDLELVRERMATLDARQGPRVGDFVRFADGTLRRISYRWTDDTGWDGGCQTSDGGSYYLGTHGVSMSGSLHPTVPTDSLRLTDERMDGSVWVFHHDMHRAHNGVDVTVSFRVFECDREAPR